MQWAEHWPNAPDPFPTFLDPFLVLIEAGDVHPVGAAHVDGPIAIEVLKFRTVRGRDDRAKIEFFPDHARERKRHAISVGEAKVREASTNRVSPGNGSGVSGFK